MNEPMTLDGEPQPYSPQCSFCAHFLGFKDGSPTCAAFRHGIPLPVWNAQVDHRKPIEGDRGIVFEPIARAGHAAAAAAHEGIDQALKD